MKVSPRLCRGTHQGLTSTAVVVNLKSRPRERGSQSKEYQSLSHTRRDCKYPIVFIPKRRKKQIFGVLKRHPGEIFHELACHKESTIVEGHLMRDHVYLCIRVPPKYAVSNVAGSIKGKSAIQIARQLGGRQSNFTG